MAILHQQTHTEEALKLIRDCEKEAKSILEKNKLLLLKMSEYLTHNTRLEEKQILKMVCEFANEDWVNESVFVKKEHYFKFAEVITKQIEEQQSLKHTV